MSDVLLALAFAGSAVISLLTSWVLVSRLERVGARLGFSEALLGMLAALAANAPEITAAVTALAGRQSRIGAGVVLGSNVLTSPRCWGSPPSSREGSRYTVGRS